MVGGQQLLPSGAQGGAGGIDLCIGGVALHHGVGAGLVDDARCNELFLLRVLDVAQTEQDAAALAGGEGQVDVQRAHRCPAVGNAAGAVPARTACGSAGPPYTPQKASRVVSKLSTGQFAQNTA